MPAPTGAIVGWPSTVGSIPAGWTRVTNLDGLYPRGGTTASGTGGANTHAHTLASHNHGGSDNHGHTVILASGSGTQNLDSGVGVTAHAAVAHNHPGGSVTFNTMTIGGTTPTASIENHEPDRYTVIWIQSDGTTAFPNTCIHYQQGTSIPTGYAKCNGGSGTPDLRGFFLKGAAAAGNGGTRTTATSHQHTATHVHSESAHGHGPGSAGGAANPGTTVVGPSGGGNAASASHQHTVTLAASAGTSTESVTAPSSAMSLEPANYRLYIVQKTTADDIRPFGMVVLWNGAEGSIPSPNWAVCDGTQGTPNLKGSSRFIKGASVDGDVGDLAGSNDHQHGSSTVAHDHNFLHTHSSGSSTVGNATPTVAVLTAFGTTVQPTGHSHGFSSIGSGGTSDPFEIAFPTEDNIPTYRNVLYMMSLAEEKALTSTANLKATGTMAILVTAGLTGTANLKATGSLSITALTLTLDSPFDGETLTTSTPLVSWSLVGETQYSYRLVVLADDDTTVVYDSGIIVSPDEFANIPAGYLQTGEEYYIYVSTVSDPSFLSSTSEHHFVTTDFATSGDVLDGALEPIGNRCTAGEVLPGARLTWSPVELSVVPPVETFLDYNVWRRVAGESEWTPIATIDDRLTTEWFDPNIAAGTTYEYSVTWEADSESGVLVSNHWDPPLRVHLTWDWPLLHLLTDESVWVPLYAFDVTYQQEQEVRFERAWGRETPTGFSGEEASQTVSLRLLPAYRRDQSQWMALTALIRRRGIMVFRSGIDHTRLFVHASRGTVLRMSQLDYTADIDLQEVYVDESAVHFQP